MTTLLFFLVAAVALLLAFCFGVVVGIKDCKRRFNVPPGAVEVDANGEYIFN